MKSFLARLFASVLMLTSMIATFSLVTPITAHAQSAPTQAELDAAYQNGQVAALLQAQTIALTYGPSHQAIASQLQTAGYQSQFYAYLFRPTDPIAAANFDGRAAMYLGLAAYYLTL